MTDAPPMAFMSTYEVNGKSLRVAMRAFPATPEEILAVQEELGTTVRENFTNPDQGLEWHGGTDVWPADRIGPDRRNQSLLADLRASVEPGGSAAPIDAVKAFNKGSFLAVGSVDLKRRLGLAHALAGQLVELSTGGERALALPEAVTQGLDPLLAIVERDNEQAPHRPTAAEIAAREHRGGVFTAVRDQMRRASVGEAAQELSARARSGPAGGGKGRMRRLPARFRSSRNPVETGDQPAPDVTTRGTP